MNQENFPIQHAISKSNYIYFTDHVVNLISSVVFSYIEDKRRRTRRNRARNQQQNEVLHEMNRLSSHVQDYCNIIKTLEERIRTCENLCSIYEAQIDDLFQHERYTCLHREKVTEGLGLIMDGCMLIQQEIPREQVDFEAYVRRMLFSRTTSTPRGGEEAEEKNVHK